jgi:hypothetical protein
MGQGVKGLIKEMQQKKIDIALSFIPSTFLSSPGIRRKISDALSCLPQTNWTTAWEGHPGFRKRRIIGSVRAMNWGYSPTDPLPPGTFVLAKMSPYDRAYEHALYLWRKGEHPGFTRAEALGAFPEDPECGTWINEFLAHSIDLHTSIKDPPYTTFNITYNYNTCVEKLAFHLWRNQPAYKNLDEAQAREEFLKHNPEACFERIKAAHEATFKKANVEIKTRILEAFEWKPSYDEAKALCANCEEPLSEDPVSGSYDDWRFHCKNYGAPAVLGAFKVFLKTYKGDKRVRLYKREGFAHPLKAFLWEASRLIEWFKEMRIPANSEAEFECQEERIEELAFRLWRAQPEYKNLDEDQAYAKFDKYESVRWKDRARGVIGGKSKREDL